METSKKIIVISYIIAILLTVITIFAFFLDKDILTLSTITGLAYGEVSVCNAFYYNKAKKENTLKIAIGCVQDNPNKATELAEIISALGGIL